MKSKRALKKLTKRKLVETSEGKRWMYDWDIAFQAVELAEQDARERAVNCIRESCVYHYNDECHKYSETAECIGNSDCYLVENFLKCYDDEQE